MSSILVKITMGPDGHKVMELGVNIQMTGVMRAGIVEQLGFRKSSKKFIDGVCKALIKQIQPQLLAAIQKENHFYEHPEDIPPPPEGVKPPPLNHALLAGPEAGDVPTTSTSCASWPMGPKRICASAASPDCRREMRCGCTAAKVPYGWTSG